MRIAQHDLHKIFHRAVEAISAPIYAGKRLNFKGERKQKGSEKTEPFRWHQDYSEGGFVAGLGAEGTGDAAPAAGAAGAGTPDLVL